MKSIGFTSLTMFQDRYDALVKAGVIFSASQITSPKGREIYVLKF